MRVNLQSAWTFHGARPPRGEGVGSARNEELSLAVVIQHYRDMSNARCLGVAHSSLYVLAAVSQMGNLQCIIREAFGGFYSAATQKAELGGNVFFRTGRDQNRQEKPGRRSSSLHIADGLARLLLKSLYS